MNLPQQDLGSKAALTRAAVRFSGRPKSSGSMATLETTMGLNLRHPSALTTCGVGETKACKQQQPQHTPKRSRHALRKRNKTLTARTKGQRQNVDPMMLSSQHRNKKAIRVSPDVGLRRASELQAEHDDVLAGVDG